MPRHAVLIVAASACACFGGTPSKLGFECVEVVECSEGLSCEYGRCRRTCERDVECPDGACLAPLDRDSRVCTIGREQDCIADVPDADVAGECPPSLYCGPDRVCREGCSDDAQCGPGRICSSGVECPEERCVCVERE